MRPARVLAAAACAAALAGCPPRAPPPDLSLDPAELAAQVRAAQGRIRSVRGEVQLRLDSPGFSGTVPALVAAEKPDRVLVHALDFFGNPVAVLAAADGELAFHDLRERVVYRGAATPENLARLVALPLSPAELVTILCGSAPLLEGEPVEAEPGRGRVTLVLAGERLAQTLGVGPGAAVLRSELRARLEPAPATYDLEFSRRDPAALLFPAETELVAAAAGVRMRLAWSDAEPNAALDRALFSPRVPSGARIVDLADAAPGGLFPGGAPPAE